MEKDDFALGVFAVAGGALLTYYLLGRGSLFTEPVTGLVHIHNVEYSKEESAMYGLAARQVDRIVGLRSAIGVERSYRLDCDVEWENVSGIADTFDIMVEYGTGPVDSFTSQMATVIEGVSAGALQLQTSRVSIEMSLIVNYDDLVGVKNSVVTVGKWDAGAQTFSRQDASSFYESVIELLPEITSGLGAIHNAVWATNAPPLPDPTPPPPPPPEPPAPGDTLLTVDTGPGFGELILKGIISVDGAEQGLAPITLSTSKPVIIGFSPIGGFQTPASQSIIPTGGEIHVAGIYVDPLNSDGMGGDPCRIIVYAKDSTGNLIVGAPVFVDGRPIGLTTEWDATNVYISINRGAGQHVVSFGDMPGYTTPNPVVLEVPKFLKGEATGVYGGL